MDALSFAAGIGAVVALFLLSVAVILLIVFVGGSYLHEVWHRLEDK